MDRSRILRIPVLIAIVLTAAVLAAVPAAADNPGTVYLEVEPVSATSVLVIWADDPLAESYRVYRAYAGNVGEVPGDVNEFLDTGLTPGLLYIYTVVSVVGGQEYGANHPDEGAMPLDAPAAITSLSWHKVTDYNNVEHLGIQLEWTPVDLVTSYEIFARIGNSGDYSQWTETVESDVLAGFALPDEPTRYWFKVRTYYEYFAPEYDNYQHGTGPFSPEAYIDVPAVSSNQWIIMPQITGWPELVVSTPKPWKIEPLRTLTVVWPTPTPWRIMPARTPDLILTTPTPMPLQPIDPGFVRPVRP